MLHDSSYDAALTVKVFFSIERMMKESVENFDVMKYKRQIFNIHPLRRIQKEYFDFVNKKVVPAKYIFYTTASYRRNWCKEQMIDEEESDDDFQPVDTKKLPPLFKRTKY